MGEALYRLPGENGAGIASVIFNIPPSAGMSGT
jgi:hypothetical protein